MSVILAEHMVTPHELFEVIGGRPFSKRVYEDWWRSAENVRFTEPAMRDRFLDFHLNHDAELIRYMKANKPELRGLTDDQILEEYHKNTLWNIASTPIPSWFLRITVASANVNGMYAHSCCNTLDVNPQWIMSTSFSEGDVPWITQADLTFMSRGYTRS
jgi:hypothetical protein